MIVGLGIDLADIRRVQRLLERYPERFPRLMFTDTERWLAARRRRAADTLARRFAAKEACAKALGTGVPRRGVHWRHIGVVNRPGGAPELALIGGALARLKKIVPPDRRAAIRLSLSDEPPYAMATVTIEALLPEDEDGGRAP